MNNVYNAPFSFDEIMTQNATYTPSSQKIANSYMARFYRKYLFQKLISVYEWDLPEEWSKDYFLYTLFGYGFLAIINTDKYGVIPQQCGLRGWDVFYRPTHTLISNPLLTGLLEPKIDVECTLIRVQPDYSSPLDIVCHYAEMMALAVSTAMMNLTNSKISYVAFAKDKAEAETFKKLYDNIASGEPAVVVDKSLRSKDGSVNWQLFDQNVGANYIVGDVLTDLRKIENMFNTDIGINNANTDKKERLITAEVEANNEETLSKAALWLEQMQEACKKTRNMFGIEIDVKWRINPNEQNVSRETEESEE